MPEFVPPPPPPESRRRAADDFDRPSWLDDDYNIEPPRRPDDPDGPLETSRYPQPVTAELEDPAIDRSNDGRKAKSSDWRLYRGEPRYVEDEIIRDGKRFFVFRGEEQPVPEYSSPEMLQPLDMGASPESPAYAEAIMEAWRKGEHVRVSEDRHDTREMQTHIEARHHDMEHARKAIDTIDTPDRPAAPSIDRSGDDDDRLVPPPPRPIDEMPAAEVPPPPPEAEVESDEKPTLEWSKADETKREVVKFLPPDPMDTVESLEIMELERDRLTKTQDKTAAVHERLVEPKDTHGNPAEKVLKWTRNTTVDVGRAIYVAHKATVGDYLPRDGDDYSDQLNTRSSYAVDRERHKRQRKHDRQEKGVAKYYAGRVVEGATDGFNYTRYFLTHLAKTLSHREVPPSFPHKQTEHEALRQGHKVRHAEKVALKARNKQDQERQKRVKELSKKARQ